MTTGSPHAADVVIIGGGIIGCSIAFRIAQARLSVIVLDRGEPGAEASSAAAGMLAPQGETVEPPSFADLCLASRELYPQFAVEVEEAGGLEVGYRRDGTLLVALDYTEEKELEEVYHHQTRRGLSLEPLNSAQTHEHLQGLSLAIRGGLFVSGDHWVDNERLMRALVEGCRQRGVQINSDQTVRRLNAKDGRVLSVEATSRSATVATSYSADQFILAAGVWSPEIAATLGIKLVAQPCRGQMMEFDAEKELPHVVRAGHHYLVPRSNRRIAVGTTAEYVGFEKRVTGEGLRSILEGAMRVAPLVKDLRFRRAWAGLRPDTADHLPVLGYGEPTNLIFATGHFRNGILLAPVTAQLTSELILKGSASQPLELYSPARFA